MKFLQKILRYSVEIALVYLVVWAVREAAQFKDYGWTLGYLAVSAYGLSQWLLGYLSGSEV